MELNATTFVFEIINFLVLLWLLYRLFFKPVQAALDARAQRQAQSAADMAQQQAELKQAQAQVQHEREALAAQRDQAFEALEHELSAQREQRLRALEADMAAEQQKIKAQLEHAHHRDSERQAQALREQASTYVGQYLTRLACPPLEHAIIELFLSDLMQQSDTAQHALRQEHPPGGTIDVATAFDVPESLRKRVQTQLLTLFDHGRPTEHLRFHWTHEPSLAAGICVHLPGHQLEASLRRGVDAFAKGDHSPPRPAA